MTVTKTNDKQELDSLKCERHLLASIFIEPDKIVDVIDKIETKMFTFEPHQHIYDIITNMYRKKLYIDRNTVWAQIQQHGHDSSYLTEADVKFISEGAGCLISGNGAQAYAEAIQSNYTQRLATEKLTTVLEMLGNKKMKAKDVSDRLNKIVVEISEASDNTSKISKGGLDTDSLMKSVEDRIETKHGISGFRTGIVEFDINIDGLQRKRITTFAGDSGSGKTALALQTAIINGLQGFTIFIGSFEMSIEECSLRMICMLANINSKAITNPKEYIRHGIDNNTFKDINDGLKFIRNKIEYGQNILNKLSIYIYENEDANIGNFISAIHKHILQIGIIDIFIIDHAELLVQDRRNLVTELYNIYRKAKDLSKKINAAGIMLHQYSNELKNSKDKYPDIFAMMGGSAPRHNSDVIAMIYNPSIYPNLIRDNPDLVDVCQMIYAKLRYAEKPSEPTDMTFPGSSFEDKVITYKSQVKTLLSNLI